MNKLIGYFSSLTIIFIMSTSLASTQQIDEKEVFPEKVGEEEVLPEDAESSSMTRESSHNSQTPIVEEPSEANPNQTFPDEESMVPPPISNPVNCAYPPIQQPGEPEESFKAKLAAYERQCTRK